MRYGGAHVLTGAPTVDGRAGRARGGNSTAAVEAGAEEEGAVPPMNFLGFQPFSSYTILPSRWHLTRRHAGT